MDDRAGAHEQTSPAFIFEAPITHPEEMRAAFHLRIGDKISLQGAGRITPAGIATIGIAITLVIGALGFLVWANRRSS